MDDLKAIYYIAKATSRCGFQLNAANDVCADVSSIVFFGQVAEIGEP